MQKDPVFGRGSLPYSLDEYREVTQKRVRRLVEYNMNSLAQNSNIETAMAWNQAILMYDSALSAKYNLNAMVSVLGSHLVVKPYLQRVWHFLCHIKDH